MPGRAMKVSLPAPQIVEDALQGKHSAPYSRRWHHFRLRPPPQHAVEIDRQDAIDASVSALAGFADVKDRISNFWLIRQLDLSQPIRVAKCMIAWLSPSAASDRVAEAPPLETSFP